MEGVQFIIKMLILIFVVTSMASMGLSLKFKDIVKPLRRPLLVFVTLVINFLVAPGIAFFLTWFLPLNTSYETGLLLLSAAAGAPFLPKLVEAAQGDVTLSVSILLLQMIGSIVLMPVTLPLLIPGLKADALSIAMPLILQLFLPLTLGLVFKHFAAGLAAKILPAFDLTSKISSIAVIILLLATNLRGMLGTLGSGAVLLAQTFVILAMAAGYLAGHCGGGSGIVQALAGGQRNIAAALVTAASNQLNEDVLAMLMVATFVGLFPLIGGALYHKRHRVLSTSADQAR